jgi:hypothetical protein
MSMKEETYAILFHDRNNVCIEEALGLLMGIQCMLFIGSRPRVRAQLEGASGRCFTDLREAESTGDEERIRQCTIAVDSADQAYRHAEKLYTLLCGEVAKIRQGRPSEIVIVRDKKKSEDYDRVLISRQSVLDWADKAITLPEAMIETRKNLTEFPDSPQALAVEKTWDGVQIHFRAHNKILIAFANGSSMTRDLENTGLLNMRNKELSIAGSALLGLAANPSIQKKSGNSGGISSRVMSGLRSALRTLAGIDSDPFYNHNQADGWKPRFQVEDRRRAGDERAKEKARHYSYKDDFQDTSSTTEYPFETDDQGDMASDFFGKHDQ